MKKKTLILFITIIGLISLTVVLYGTGRPGFGSNHSGCHDSSGYSIGTTAPGEIQATISSSVEFNITATGTNLFVQAIPGAEHNDLFVILPTTGRINDTSINDLDPASNSILVAFSLTTPNETGYYTIFIIAGNDASGQINFDYLEINVNVGGVAAPGFDWSIILDHLGLYLGLPALIFLTLGTVLVLVNENKFVKTHGILAGGSWILTMINTVVGIIFGNIGEIPITNWFGAYPLIYHIPHIVLGAIGLVTGFFSMLFGIAAERKPAMITGYITLISWWSAFFLGYFLNPDLLLLL
ncbi:MAG: hypothetical protein ACXACO_04300 [Promethearchaeota archaeon]|jgi:hypothetical protein